MHDIQLNDKLPSNFSAHDDSLQAQEHSSSSSHEVPSNEVTKLFYLHPPLPTWEKHKQIDGRKRNELPGFSHFNNSKPQEFLTQ